MKKLQTSLIATAAALLALCGCSGAGNTLKTESFSFEDSAKFADLTIEAQLPVPSKGAAGVIRKNLIDIMDGQLAFIGSYEGDRLFEPYSGDPDDNAAIVEYYRRKALDTMEESASSDYEERAGYIRESEDLTEEEKEEALKDTPRWEYSFKLEKQYETDRYVVFVSSDYIYMGGAHGGVLGQGSPTFDKKDGHRVEKFLRDDALNDMQSLLVAGLVEYFSDAEGSANAENIRDFLFIEEGEPIPFPAWTPHPTKEGLCLVYQQYEIAAYAMGMPAFIIPYDAVKPYLTPDAADLLNLK